MTDLVVDSSAVVAALTGVGEEAAWADQVLASEVSAPHLMPVEVASTLRRLERGGEISSDVASLANHDLLSVRAELFPYAALGGRVWQLRRTVTPYDAWYVALAEELGVPLATLDDRLTRAPGPRCAFVTPEP